MNNHSQELLSDTVLLNSHDPMLQADGLKSIRKAVKDLVDGESTCNFIFLYLNYCRHKTLCSGSLSLHMRQKLLEKQLKLLPSPKSLMCRKLDKRRCYLILKTSLRTRVTITLLFFGLKSTAVVGFFRDHCLSYGLREYNM